jgi:hypothetical protein
MEDAYDIKSRRTDACAPIRESWKQVPIPIATMIWLKTDKTTRTKVSRKLSTPPLLGSCGTAKRVAGRHTHLVAGQRGTSRIFVDRVEQPRADSYDPRAKDEKPLEVSSLSPIAAFSHQPAPLAQTERERKKVRPTFDAAKPTVADDRTMPNVNLQYGISVIQ